MQRASLRMNDLNKIRQYMPQAVYKQIECGQGPSWRSVNLSTSLRCTVSQALTTADMWDVTLSYIVYLFGLCYEEYTSSFRFLFFLLLSSFELNV